MRGPETASFAQPDAMFIFASRFLAFDHVSREMYLVALVDGASVDGAERVESWFNAMEDSLAGIGLPPP